MARGAPTITHMFFADDGSIYCHAKKEEASQVMNLLSIFNKASG